MRRRKFFITLSFIVGAGLIGVVFVAGKTASLAKEEKKAFDFTSSEAPHLTKAEGLPYGSQKQTATSTDSGTNSEESLSGLTVYSVLRSLITSAKEGKIVQKGRDNALDLLSNKDIIDEAVRNAFSSIDFQPIGIGEIKLITNDSQSAKERYAEQFKKLRDRNGDLPYDFTYILEQASQGRNGRPAQETAAYFNRILEPYLQTDVPPSAAAFHLWAVNYLKKMEWTFELLGQAPNDPVKGLMAMNLLQTLPVEEADTLKEILQSLNQ